MAIGAADITQLNINNLYGNWSKQLKSIFANNASLKAVVDALSGGNQAGLVALGFSSADATAIITLYNELDTLRQVYYGLMFVAAGATVNSGTPTVNDATHFGHNWDIAIGKAAGLAQIS